MSRNYKQGIFRPKNPDKYHGDSENIVYRSSWEYKFCNWADTSKHVISWSSEETIIPYISPVDNRHHRYFVDFKLKIQSLDGIKEYLVEIKPESQTMVPNRGMKHKKTFLNEIATYAVNKSKWIAAERYAIERGMKFIIMTEKHLGIK